MFPLILYRNITIVSSLSIQIILLGFSVLFLHNANGGLGQCGKRLFLTKMSFRLTGYNMYYQVLLLLLLISTENHLVSAHKRKRGLFKLLFEFRRPFFRRQRHSLFLLFVQ
jgi:hypothetical protein